MGRPTPPETDGGETLFSFNAWQFARRRRGTIAAGAALGMMLGLCYCVWKGREYESTARVLVVKKRLDTAPLTGTSPSQLSYEDYLSTHQVVITSPRVVQEAISLGGLAELDCFRGRENLTRAVVESLGTDRVFRVQGGMPPTNVLNLSFRANDPEDAQTVLQAVLASYEKFLKDTSRDTHAEALELVGRAKDVLHNDIADKETAYLKFRESAPVTVGKEGKTLQQDRLVVLDGRRSALRVRRAELEAAVDAVARARADGKSPAQVLSTLTSLQPEAAPVGLATGRDVRQAAPVLEAELASLHLEEAKLLEGFGPAHEQVRAVRSRIETVSRLLAPPPAGEGSAREAELLDLRVRMLARDLEANRRAEQALERLYAQEEKEARTAAVNEARDESFRKGIERGQVLYESIIKRLQEVDAVKDAGGFTTQVLARPERGVWLWKRSGLVVAAATFAGLLLGVGGALAREVSDRRFRTPGEVRQRLGVPVMSHIPLRRHLGSGPAVAGVSRGVCTWHQPDSPEAEAYRAVRTALVFSTAAGGHSVVQITSAEAREGKTTLAANLAVAVAQSGLRVLLIDADLRRPRLHSVFGLANEPGLTSVLAGHAGAPDVIRATAVPNLSVLPSGPVAPNPSELLTLPRLKELLDGVREEFDLVLVDTPPLLDVTDASAVAARADGVILTLDIQRKDGRAGAERAKALLDRLGANVLGVVVNGVPCPKRSSYYGFAQFPEDAAY